MRAGHENNCGAPIHRTHPRKTKSATAKAPWRRYDEGIFGDQRKSPALGRAQSASGEDSRMRPQSPGFKTGAGQSPMRRRSRSDRRAKRVEGGSVARAPFDIFLPFSSLNEAQYLIR
jgi:hypothetical protein